MTLMRDVIEIPERVTDTDFVMKLADGVAEARQTIRQYVVTDSLRGNFAEALGLVGHAVETGRSQAAFLHGSFGAGKSHFMAVLHEILIGNPDARAIPDLVQEVDTADRWLAGATVLPLTYHMLGARSVEEAVLGGYRAQITRLHPDAPPPAVHRSDALLEDAARFRANLGDEKFFHTLSGGGAGSAEWGRYQGGNWHAERYAAAAASAPGTLDRDQLVSDLTATFFSGAVHSGEYLDIDTGLAVLSQHARSLGYDLVVLFLDEFVLWLSQHLSNLEFVNEQGGKLAKFVESADAHRPVPLVSFVARQRDLADFLGPHVPGAERQAFSDVFRHGRGRYQQISLEERNLPLIAEKRLLAPKDAAARRILDDAFRGVSRRPEIWDTLRLGAQFDDAGIGSDEMVFRRLYPFSPALVATLVALSQALQRERTALKTMLRLLVARRDTLRVNDLIGVAELFDELVGRGELPDEPSLRKHFETARSLYRTHLRPLLLRRHSLKDAAASAVPDTHDFRIADKLVKTLLLAALVPDVPALRNLTATRLHALNYGSIASPLPGLEPQIVLERLRELAAEAPEIRVGDGPDPVISIELSQVDYQAILDRVPVTEDNGGARRRLLRELICGELGVAVSDEMVTHGFSHFHEWRGRRHTIDMVFGNVRDPDELPESALRSNGDTWRFVIDYPFDSAGHSRRDDIARVESLRRNGVTARTVFWLPYYLTDDRLGQVGTLVKLNYVLAGGGDRLYSLASDMSATERQQAKIMLEQMQGTVRERLRECLKQGYGAASPQSADVEADTEPVFHTLAEGLRVDELVGGTLKAAFGHLIGQVLTWSHPGTPNLPVDATLVRPADVRKVLEVIGRAVADPTRGVIVDERDRPTVKRICNPLRLGELDDNKYALNHTTSWWTRHFLQGAAQEGYTDHYPVRVLRELTERPESRGLDRPVQNLLIVAFALDQDLGWFQHGAQVPAPPLEHVMDDFELRHPRMPDDRTWTTARERAAALLGRIAPQLRSAANVAELARMVRQTAKDQVAACRELVTQLRRHAVQLGLDPAAETGRLATAARVAALLDQLAQEPDDVVLVELLASADLGSVDDTTASKSMTTAHDMVTALARTHQWDMLGAIARLTDDRAGQAQAILEQLADAAAREQMHQDLIVELDRAVQAGADLLAESRTAPPAAQPASQPYRPVVSAPTRSPGVSSSAVRGERVVGDRSELREAEAEIAEALERNPGKRIRVTWAVAE